MAMPVPSVSMPSISVMLRRADIQTRKLDNGMSANSKTCAGVGNGSKKLFAHMCVVNSTAIATTGRITPPKSRKMPGFFGGFSSLAFLEPEPEIGFGLVLECGSVFELKLLRLELEPELDFAAATAHAVDFEAASVLADGLELPEAPVLPVVPVDPLESLKSLESLESLDPLAALVPAFLLLEPVWPGLPSG